MSTYEYPALPGVSPNGIDGVNGLFPSWVIRRRPVVMCLNRQLL